MHTLPVKENIPVSFPKVPFFHIYIHPQKTKSCYFEFCITLKMIRDIHFIFNKFLNDTNREISDNISIYELWPQRHF